MQNCTGCTVSHQWGRNSYPGSAVVSVDRREPRYRYIVPGVPGVHVYSLSQCTGAVSNGNILVPVFMDPTTQILLYKEYQDKQLKGQLGINTEQCYHCCENSTNSNSNKVPGVLGTGTSGRVGRLLPVEPITILSSSIGIPTHTRVQPILFFRALRSLDTRKWLRRSAA